MIGSGRGKIEKPEDLQKAADVAQELQLDGLIVCGGDDSNTNAAVLAEFFKAKGAYLLLLASKRVQPARNACPMLAYLALFADAAFATSMLADCTAALLYK